MLISRVIAFREMHAVPHWGGEGARGCRNQELFNYRLLS